MYSFLKPFSFQNVALKCQDLTSFNTFFFQIIYFLRLKFENFKSIENTSRELFLI